jgi:GDP-L-fucose synthase
MKGYSGEEHLNVGTGIELTIRQLAELIARVASYEGGFSFDSSKPDGSPRKVMQVERLAGLGWRAPTSLEDGFRKAYDWYVANLDHVRR